MDSDFTDEQHFALAASPPAWKDFAVELHNSASMLWSMEGQGLLVSSDGLGRLMKKSHISRTFLLLAAQSVENLLKAIIISEQPSLVSNGELSKEIRSHKLTYLAGLISEMDFHEEEVNLLNIFQEAISYWGRYPSPLYSDQLTLEKVATDEFHAEYERLYDRIHRHLYQLIRNGWQGPHEIVLGRHYDSELEDGG